MANCKVFISHSSKQKAIAEQIRAAIGADFCILDKFDFEPAYKTLDEIYRCLNKTGIFTFLISKDSLGSDWVSKEVNKAKEYVKEGKIAMFAPYIVDDTTLDKVPAWIRDEEC